MGPARQFSIHANSHSGISRPQSKRISNPCYQPYSEGCGKVVFSQVSVYSRNTSRSGLWSCFFWGGGPQRGSGVTPSRQDGGTPLRTGYATDSIVCLLQSCRRTFLFRIQWQCQLFKNVGFHILVSTKHLVQFLPIVTQVSRPEWKRFQTKLSESVAGWCEWGLGTSVGISGCEGSVRPFSHQAIPTPIISTSKTKLVSSDFFANERNQVSVDWKEFIVTVGNGRCERSITHPRLQHARHEIEIELEKTAFPIKRFFQRKEERLQRKPSSLWNQLRLEIMCQINLWHL